MKEFVDVTFVSEWNNDKIIETNAKFNWNTGEVVKVGSSEEDVDGTCARQFIRFKDGTELDIDEEIFISSGNTFVANEVVLSFKEKEKGYIIGDDDETDCGVESCTGTNYIVYWQDGERTLCCGKGLNFVTSNVYQIM